MDGRRRERVAAWALRGALTASIGAACVASFLLWAAESLSWPMWADHDVFATAAMSWDRGVLPYRDFQCNNFPGTIYVFWLLGRIVGFGRPLAVAFRAFDAAFVLIWCLALMTWGRRSFGTRLPGAVAMAAFLADYLALDYGLSAQRDWHGPALGLMGLMAAQTIGGRSRFIWSCLPCILGVAIRPQAVLLVPAILWAFWAGNPRGMRAAGTWLLLFVLGGIAAFSPILLAGLGRDFARSIGVVGPGSAYNQVTIASFAEGFLTQFRPLRLLLLPIAVAWSMLGRGLDQARLATPWVIAFLATSLYAPISPVAHAYLSQPLRLVGIIHLALLVGWILRIDGLNASVRLAMVLALLGLSVIVPGRLPSFREASWAWSSLARGEPRREPSGYRPSPGHGILGQYPWADSRDLLAYLRRETSPTTRIANGLMLLPAVTGPVGRLSAFPTESVAWLRVVRPEDEERFARSLLEADDSVVVWAPKEPDSGRFTRLTAVYRDRYEFRKSFGVIEVWTRKSTGEDRSRRPRGENPGR